MAKYLVIAQHRQASKVTCGKVLSNSFKNSTLNSKQVSMGTYGKILGRSSTQTSLYGLAKYCAVAVKNSNSTLNNKQACMAIFDKNYAVASNSPRENIDINNRLSRCK